LSRDLIIVAEVQDEGVTGLRYHPVVPVVPRLRIVAVAVIDDDRHRCSFSFICSTLISGSSVSVIASDASTVNRDLSFSGVSSQS